MELKAPIIKVADGFEIRMPRDEDALPLSRVVDDNREYLKRWLPWLDASQCMQDSMDFIQRTQGDWALKRIYTGLIYRKNEIAGAIGFHTKVHKYMAMGYWVSQSFAGKGLCTESSKALIKWAFKFYDDVHLIELKAATENQASRKIAEKLKFKFEGVLRQREWLYDHYVDHSIYSITREEWAQLHK